MKQLKRWQEPLYGIGGFGATLMYQVAMSYILAYYVPTASDMARGALVLAPPALFGVLFFVARMLDGGGDIPIATWTDNLKSRFGRRRPFMVLGFLPMIAFFVLMWFPPVAAPAEGGSVLNTVYLAIISVLFFFFYTMMAVPYLSALSEIVPDEKSRVRVASWQTFFNTIAYVLVYVLVPVLFSKFGMRTTVLMLTPIMLTYLFPLFVIKEDSTLGGVNRKAEPDVGLAESFRETVKNKNFQIYLLSLATFFFGLQTFLGGIKYMANDMMGLSDAQMGMMNAAAFAPIPLMLLLFNFITRKRGSKTAFRISLLVFAAAMLLFPLGWTKLGLSVTPMVVGIAAGAVGSFSIAAFFTIPYAYPAQIAAEDAAVTGKNRAGMFFAVQGFVNQIVGALAGSLVLANLVSIRSEAVGTGAIFIGPVAALACVASFFLSKRLTIGQKTVTAKVEEQQQ
ncbi:MAG TPA: MFS transporter [Clostridia bacterium]|nr:MFS transporter [Clostridia bacterium]